MGLSSLDEEDEYDNEITMMQAVLIGTKCAEEHVLNFKGSIKGLLQQIRREHGGHLTLMEDHFPLNALFIDNFRRRFQMRFFLNRLYDGVRAYAEYFILKRDAVLKLDSLGAKSAWLH